MFEIPTNFKDFLSVINFHNNFFGKNKFKRNTFHQMDSGNKKRLYRLNIIMNLFHDHVDHVGMVTAINDYSKVFDNEKNELNINRLLRYVKNIKNI